MDIEQLANRIFTKYPPKSFIPKEWMHEQFGYEYRTARLSTEHMPYAREFGSLRQHLMTLNRVLEPSDEGWTVLEPNQHAAYAEKTLRRAVRRGIRESSDILNATEIRKLNAAERKDHQDTRNFLATFRDISEKAFKRKNLFVEFEKKTTEQSSH